MPKLLDVDRERFHLACMDIKEVFSAGHLPRAHTVVWAVSLKARRHAG